MKTLLPILALALASAPSVAYAQGVCDADLDAGSALGFLAAGSTCGAGDDAAATCGGASEDVSVAWTAPADGRYVFDTAGSAFDTVLSVRDAGCAELACTDDTWYALDGAVDVTLLAGETVRLDVDGYNACGDYTLSVGLCQDDDGDGVCNEFDECLGDDATFDFDGDLVCNDRDFMLSLEKIAPGIEETFRVTNAPPGSTVVFLAARSLGSRCILGTRDREEVCIGLGPVRELGRATADANGGASLSFVNPDYDALRVVYQAVWVTPTDGDVSLIVSEKFTSHVLLEGTYEPSAFTLSNDSCDAYGLMPVSYDLTWLDADVFVLSTTDVPAPDVTCVRTGEAIDCDGYEQILDLGIVSLAATSRIHSEAIIHPGSFTMTETVEITCKGPNCAAFGFPDCALDMVETFEYRP
jgi:hypothetical protein